MVVSSEGVIWGKSGAVLEPTDRWRCLLRHHHNTPDPDVLVVATGRLEYWLKSRSSCMP